MVRIEAWLDDHVNPDRRSRVIVAILAGLLGVSFCYIKYLTMPDHPGDFGLAWFGARSMLAGKNPYALVGPGLTYDWPWPLVYPGTAFVVALPFAPIPQLTATLLFVFISSALLAYSITKKGWHLLPILGSSAFIVAAGAAQWSPLFTAAIGIPILALFFAAKPTIGIALAIASERRVQVFALAGALVIAVTSLLMFPSWPGLWMKQLHFATQMAAPVMRPGGFFILLALIRWRRPEARLLIALACIPQVGSWYEALPVFLVVSNYREAMILSIASLAGFHLGAHLPDGLDETQINQWIGALMVAWIYLPAIIIVLRRPPKSTDGKLPYLAASPSR